MNYDKSTNTLSRNQKIQNKNQEHFFGYAWIIIDNYKHSRIDKQTLFNSSLSIDVWIASSKMKPICNAILTTLYLCTYILNLTQHMQVMIELRDIWTTNRYVCWQEKLDMISIVDYTLPQAFFDFQIELKYTKIYFKNRTNHNYDLSENLLLTIPIELRKCQQKVR